MQNAITEVLLTEKPNISQIASRNHVSRDQRLTGNIKIDAHPGRPAHLSKQEEDQLANFLIEMADLGFGFSLQKIKTLVRKLFDKNSDITSGWLLSFFARHTEITLRRVEALDRLRCRAVDEGTIQFYFSLLFAAFKKCEQLSNGISLTRNRIYAMDETRLQANKKFCYVVVERESKSVFSLCSENREHLTIVAFDSKGLRNSEASCIFRLCYNCREVGKM